VNAAVQSAAMKGPLDTLGMIGLGNKSLDQFQDYVRSETERWAKVIKEAGLAGTQ
jgi:tripartite-type tricarboxylate transporter receptor subunit TctC